MKNTVKHTYTVRRFEGIVTVTKDTTGHDLYDLCRKDLGEVLYSAKGKKYAPIFADSVADDLCYKEGDTKVVGRNEDGSYDVKITCFFVEHSVHEVFEGFVWDCTGWYHAWAKNFSIDGFDAE